MPDSLKTAAIYRDLAEQCAGQAAAASAPEERQTFAVAERNWRKLEEQARKRDGGKPADRESAPEPEE